MPAKVRLHALFKGTVQGVGFRFSTERIAHRFNLVGFARNLSDGRVEVVVEGERKVLDDFLDSILSGDLGSYITGVDTLWEHPTGEFEDFRLRF